MIRTAIRTLTLSIYKVEDKSARAFVVNKDLAPPYFVELAWFINSQFLALDRFTTVAYVSSPHVCASPPTHSLTHSLTHANTPTRQHANSDQERFNHGQLTQIGDETVDIFYYLQDILALHIPELESVCAIVVIIPSFRHPLMLPFTCIHSASPMLCFARRCFRCSLATSSSKHRRWMYVSTVHERMALVG